MAQYGFCLNKITQIMSDIFIIGFDMSVLFDWAIFTMDVASQYLTCLVFDILSYTRVLCR